MPRPGPPSTDFPPPLPNRRRRSRTPGGRRRGAGAPVGKGGISGPRRRRPPPRGPHPFMGPGYKVGGPVPEINDAAVAKYQHGGMAPTVAPRFPSRPSMQQPSWPGQRPGPQGLATNASRAAMTDRMHALMADERSRMNARGNARGRATPPALGPQKPKRRGRGRGGRDV